MADYQTAFNFLMDDEDRNRSGVIVSDPEPEAPTARARFGLNSYWHPDLAEAAFFSYNPDATPKVPNDEALVMAAEAYRKGEWASIRGDSISNQDIANKFLSLAVNDGSAEATKIVQRAVNRVVFPLPGELGLRVDGICGEQTLSAINQAQPADLLSQIKYYACQFYRDCAFRMNWDDKELNAHLARANR